MSDSPVLYSVDGAVARITLNRPDVLNALNAAQKAKVLAAAQAAAAYNNENRIKEEAQLVEFFKKEGLQVTVPNVDAFHKSVQATYMASDYAKVWPKGLLDRINATK